ncbi:MAG: hypothetical protein RL217_559 [Pseudomonadota bacterium]|jgi:universal stress protein E
MQYINNILVVLDKGQSEQPALNRALWLARSVKATVTLLANTWDAYGAENATLDEDTRHQLKSGLLSRDKQWLQSFVKDVTDIKIEYDVHWHKHLYEAVMHAAEEDKFDMVIKSTKPHRLMDRIFTHEDWNLLRHCPIPVLLVKGTQAWQHNRILACIDATSPDDGHQLINDNILTFAEQLSDHFDTDLHLVNAYPMVNVAFAMVPEVTAPDDLHSYIEQQHRDACAQWARKYNVNQEQLHVQEGDPENVVSELTKSLGADLVVIGSVGRTGISSVLIGNTAELLMDKVTCDVLVIKPEQGVKDVD